VTSLPSHPPRSTPAAVQCAVQFVCSEIAKFHYTDPTGPAQTFLRPESPRNSVASVRVSDKVRAGPVGSGQARVVEFSYKRSLNLSTCE